MKNFYKLTKSSRASKLNCVTVFTDNAFSICKKNFAKHIILSTIFLFIMQGLALGQTIIWSENFTYNNGTNTGSGSPSGVSSWTADGSSGPNNYYGITVYNNQLRGRNTANGNPDYNTWVINSESPIDISNYNFISVSVEISEGGTLESGDYIRVEYNINETGWYTFETNGYTADDFGSATATQNNLSGNTLRLRITMINNANNEYYYADNIVVTGSNMPIYCTSNFANIFYEFISNVTFSGINNSSAGNTGGPVNYTNLVAQVVQGNTYAISVTIEPDNNDFIYGFIDWNQNGILNDAGEVYTIASNTSSAGPHTLNINVPSGATIGATRMRVMVDWDNDTPNPCRSATYGESEDYTVNVLPACIAPSVPTILASSSSICIGGSTTLSIASGNLNDADHWQWYSGSCGGTSVGQGLSVTVSPGATTTYYVRGEGSSCDGINCGSVTVTVGPQVINAAGQVEWISKIDVGSYSKTSGASGYSDFTSEVIDLEKNTSHNITLTPGFSASSYDEYWRVWIDFNENGDFSDAGELLYSGNSDSAIINSISIPDVTVSTTMRVAMKGSRSGDLTVPGGNVTANAVNSPTGEEIDKLVDNIVNVANKSKYLTRAQTGWVQYQFPGNEKYIVTKYAITSANDYEGRDPKDWILQGSNDGISWTVIDTRTNEDFANRWLRREFTCTNTTAYNYYRLDITANSGEPLLQIGEWELFEINDNPYPEPCETFSYGEVEDYTVNITAQCSNASLTLNTENDYQIVCEGESVTDIEYSVGGSAIGAEVTNLPTGVTGNFIGGILTIRGTPTETGTFVYTVTTTGTPAGCIETTATGTIVINPLPTFITQPTDLNICEADFGSFTVAVSASSPTYQWQYSTPANPTNWLNVPDAAGIIAGATTNNLQILTADMVWDKYNISCLITSNGCSIQSNAVKLNVNPPLTAPPAGNVTVTYDGSSHTASATAGAEETIDWYTSATGGTSTTAPSGTNVGTYTAWAEARNTTTGCVSVGRTEVSLTINERSLTITTDDLGKNCGDVDPVLTYHITSGSLAGGDSFTGSLTRQAGEVIGTYSILQGTLTLSSNYDLSYFSGTFEISDNIAPVPDVSTLPDITAECSVTSLIAPTAIDNCMGSITATHNAILPITAQGTTIVTWTYDDGNGNTTTQTQNVIINDVTDPIITCPADVNQNVDPGLCTATGVSLGTPVTSDNCGIASVTNNAPASFPLGITVVTWTVTDIAGNTATCDQNVNITPEEDIDIRVEDLGNDCQSGETGSTTTIIWDITKISGTDNWIFDYEIKEDAITVASGTSIAASGNTQVSYEMDNETAQNKTYTITIFDVKDACGSSEINTVNNSDTVTFSGVPATTEIITN